MFILFLFKDSSFYWTGNKVYGILLSLKSATIIQYTIKGRFMNR